MVKNLFKQTSEEEIKKAFIRDQAPYLHKWVKISGSLTFFSIILFSFFLDFTSFHYTLTEILKVRIPPLLAVGERVFSFDIWGDLVNTASRVESASFDGKICISESCYNSVKNYFTFRDRG